MEDHKNNIIAILESLKSCDYAKNEVWKVRAYAKAIKQLKGLDRPIRTVQDVEGVPGIGEKIRAKIKEIIDTGSLGQVENLDESVHAINELTKIFGVGPMHANELYQKHGITCIDDLKTGSNIELLNDKQKIGLKYYKHFERRIPRAEMDKHAKAVQDALNNISHSKIQSLVVGSYRRGAKDSGDIDVLITHEEDPKDFSHIIGNVVSYLQKDGYLKDTFALGGKKYNGVCKLKHYKTFRRIDILYTPKHERPFALLYFTGSQGFNIQLRHHALSLGYSLSEYGLKYNTGDKKGEYVDEKFATEEDVLKFLKINYVAPHKRSDNIQLGDYEIVD